MFDPTRVIAELTFLDAAHGGRTGPSPQPPWDERERWYMPHVVVEGSPEYLGVRIVDGPAVSVGEPGRFELHLMYSEVDYSALKPGVTIAICEGGRIVAQGQVLQRG